MPIEIKVDTEKVEARLRDMVEKIKATGARHVPNEFMAWQEEDMKRPQPHVNKQFGYVFWTQMPVRRKRRVRKRPLGATSSVSAKPKRPRKPKPKKPKKVRLILPATLRPRLRASLIERMREMLKEKIAW